MTLTKMKQEFTVAGDCSTTHKRWVKKRYSVNPKIGRLTVVGIFRDGDKIRVKCRCECGSETSPQISNIRNGHTRSCGCLQKTHRMIHAQTCGRFKNSKQYRAWCAMRSRCLNANNPQYKDYGGRGIKICERWNDYLNFESDIGEPNSPLMSLERVDNDKGYCPENCRWATKAEQNDNKQNTRRIQYRGALITITELVRVINIKRSYIYYWAYEKGLSVEDVINKYKAKFPDYVIPIVLN